MFVVDNSVVLAGRLGTDPEVVEFRNGKKAVRLFVICRAGWDSEAKEEITKAVGCTYFDRGEEFARNLATGDQVIIHGWIDYNVYKGELQENVRIRNLEFGARKA